MPNGEIIIPRARHNSLQAEVELAACVTKLKEFEEQELECLADVEKARDEVKATS